MNTKNTVQSILFTVIASSLISGCVKEERKPPSFSFDPDMSFYTPEDRELMRESGAEGTPEYMAK